jgi:hypothetical protein
MTTKDVFRKKRLELILFIRVLTTLFILIGLSVGNPQLVGAFNTEEVEDWSPWLWADSNAKVPTTFVFPINDSAGWGTSEAGQKIKIGDPSLGLGPGDTFEISACVSFWKEGADLRARIRKVSSPYDVVEGSDTDLAEPTGTREWVTGSVTLDEPISGDYWFCVYAAGGDVDTMYYLLSTDHDNTFTGCAIYWYGSWWCEGRKMADPMIRVRQEVGTNQVPVATINSIDPDPAVEGESVSFEGSGWDPDGSIVEYDWRSDVDGQLSSDPSFSTTDLSVGPYTIYFRVKDDKGTSSPEVSRTLTIDPLVVPEVTGDIEAKLGFGTFVSGISVPVKNKFSIYVNPEGFTYHLKKVVFTITGNGYEKTIIDTVPSENWWRASFNMSELPVGSSTLTAIAYDEQDNASEPVTAKIETEAKPAWFGQSWVYNSTAKWSRTKKKYTFTGEIPSDPRLYYREDLGIPLFGILENSAGVNIVITETRTLDKKWTWSAEGGLNATILGQDLWRYDYDFSKEDGEYSFYFETPTLFDVTIPLYDGVIATAVVDFVQFQVNLSIDCGLRAKILLYGEISSDDLKVSKITVTPDVTAAITLDLRLDLYTGVVGFGVRGTPTFDFKFPVVYEDAHDPNIYLDTPCITFILIVEPYVSFAWGWGEWSGGEMEFAHYSWPEECSLSASRAMAGQFERSNDLPRLFHSPSIASDDSGNSIVVWIHDEDSSPDVTDPEVYYSYWKDSTWSIPRPLNSINNQRYENDPKVVFFAPNKAMAVWAQNELSREESEGREHLNEILVAQELYYSIWDGTTRTWSVSQPLTRDESPDGRVSIAADTANQKVLVTWVRDCDGDIQNPNSDWEIYYREWDGNINDWSSPPLPVTENAVADVEVDVEYAPGGEIAYAVWVQDTDNDFITNRDRQIVYSIWNGESWTTPIIATWQPGVLWPSVAFESNGDPIMVFTARGDSQGRDPGGTETGEG